MDQPKLPIELISLILRHLLRANGGSRTDVGDAVQFRLVSKDVKAEVERMLFVEAFLDIEYYRSTDCLQCVRIVRAERSNKALNRSTCLRYMVALLGIRDLPKWDMRIKQWTVMRQAVEELEVDPEFVEKVLQIDARVSEEAKSVLDFIRPRGVTAERQLVVSRALADALVTLLGVRNTWANFGPHHDSCGTQAWSNARTVTFWKLVAASHVGDLAVVRDCLNIPPTTQLVRSLPTDQLGKKLRKARQGSDEYEKHIHYMSGYFSAALTVAVRQGHQNIIDHIFTQYEANSNTELVLITNKYFNKSSVLCAAVEATNHKNKDVARVAVRTVDRILDLWDTFSTAKFDAAYNERLVMRITPDAPNLFRKAIRKLCSNSTKEISKDVLLEISQTGDVEKMRYILEYLKKASGGLKDTRMTNPTWCDEYGVGLDRILKRSNPFTIAAALGHVEILRLFKGCSVQVERTLPSGTSMKNDKIGTMKQFRCRDQSSDGVHSDIHPVRDAVNEVFIKHDRLPGRKFRKDPPVEALRALLELAPDISWGAETIACAGLGKPAYLRELLHFVKLGEWFPDIGGDQRPHTLEGAKNVTIGERALQHALRAVRADNVKILLDHGAKLAEGVRIANPIFADQKQASEIEQLLAVLASDTEFKDNASKIAWSSRDLSVHYFAPGKESLSIDDAREIEKDNSMYKWQVGNKSRGSGKPTAWVAKDDDTIVEGVPRLGLSR